MQQSAPNRKPPPPGASPMMQPVAPQPAYQYQQAMPENADFNNFDYSNAFSHDPPYSDPSFTDANNLSTTLNASQPATFGSNIAPAPSTDLVRRTRNQQLAPQNGQQEQWNGAAYGNMNGQEGEEDEHALDMKVALAKRDAQGKRKQIPPFVQKLSSFLDSNNTDLIRWSDDGRAFIVLDEDEFARTLIPELFKHNNYASFVRQLNMYGFHKTVNITDGSLRQSEKARKGVKPPSMYSHPYFRKNRPDLLWLIQKPTGKSNAKRKRDGNIKDGFDSDEERQFSPGPDGRPQGELGAAGGHQDLSSMPRSELASVRQELKKLQQQQNIISRMIGQLKEQNDQFYRQATAFQALHDRHENSINAILTFLATFYNRSLEGHSGQNLVNMFSNVGGQNNQQQQGSVVEEYNDGTPDATNSEVQRYGKKPQLLLTGPNAPYSPAGNVATAPNSTRPSVSPPDRDSPQFKTDSTANTVPYGATSTAAGASASPVVKDDAPTPDVLNQVPESSSQMMSMIHIANANATTNNTTNQPYDFLNQCKNANGGTAMTQQQQDMFAAIANHSTGSTSNNNSLTPANAPDINMHTAKIAENDGHIRELRGSLKDTSEKINELQQRITPYSPLGGTHLQDPMDLTNLGTPGQYDANTDFDALLNYPGDVVGNESNADIEFYSKHPESFNFEDLNWDPNAAMFSSVEADGLHETTDELLPPQAAGKVESLSSEGTSPAATIGNLVEDADANDFDAATPAKRQRRV